MLLSAGLPLPTTIYVHEYVTVGGQKISKSLGNAIDPVALTRQFGTDPLRYWLLREVPRTEDGDFTVERLIARTNGDLANGLGNLLQRTLRMITRWRAGVVPANVAPDAAADALLAQGNALPDQIAAALDRFDFRTALSVTWSVIATANRYIDDTAPWTLAKAAQAGDGTAARQLDTVLATLAQTLLTLAQQLAPFLPGTSQAMLSQLGYDAAAIRATPDTPWRVNPGTALFPRIEQ
jgi:methionyl-tRNA synthetase